MSEDRNSASKVYCEKCDTVFSSRRDYDRHYQKHSGGVACESCPIDSLVSRVARLFRKGS